MKLLNLFIVIILAFIKMTPAHSDIRRHLSENSFRVSEFECERSSFAFDEKTRRPICFIQFDRIGEFPIYLVVDQKNFINQYREIYDSGLVVGSFANLNVHEYRTKDSKRSSILHRAATYLKEHVGRIPPPPETGTMRTIKEDKKNGNFEVERWIQYLFNIHPDHHVFEIDIDALDLFY